MGKKVKKAFKGITKIASKIPGSGFSDNEQQKAPEIQEAPVVQQQQQAQAVETPKEDITTDENDKDTESARKAARKGGKNGLSVARSSGSGLNI